MHVVVCISYIEDPETPARQFRLDERAGRLTAPGASLVIGPFEENALEMALQLKDAAGARVTALTLGPAANEDALRRALAVRCDAAVHVREDRAADLDSTGVALLLAAALREMGDVDLVMCGRQVGDWDGGQVGQLIAEELGFSCVTLARRVEQAGAGALRATKEVPGGIAEVEADLPTVATATNTWANQLRVARVKDILAARRAFITTWTGADLGLDPEALAGDEACAVVRRLFTVEAETRGEMIEGDDYEGMADTLARRILDMKVL